MKLKIVLLALAFCLLVPGLNAFAYEGGLINGKTMNKGISENDASAGQVTVWTDNILTSRTDLKRVDSYSYGWYEFPQLVDLTNYQLKANGIANNYRLRFYDAKGSLISELAPNVENSKRSINVTGVKKVALVNLSPNNLDVYEFDVFGVVNTSIPVIKYDPVTDLSETHTHDSMNLRWNNPTGIGLKETVIKKDGIEIVRLSNTATSYSLRNLIPDSTYEFEVISVYSDGTAAPAQKITVITDKPPQPGEVESLTAKPTHERVNLSWELPDSNILKHVNIYRDERRDMAFLDKALGFTSVSAAATTKIFETNGTYFNDLTVKPETEYEYTLTTLDTFNRESEGVTKVVQTLEAPPPEIIGGGYTTDPATGDFIYYWSEPNKGEVKILIAGKEYKIVNAADKKISIPQSDMKYTGLGDPNVSLVPIGTDGKVGGPVKPGLNGVGSGDSLENVKLPFEFKDLITSSNGLFFLIGGFVLLLLAFIFVPKFVRMIMQSFKANKPESSVAEVESRRTGTVRAEVVRSAPRIPRAPKSDRESSWQPRMPRSSERQPRAPRSGRGDR